jgi:hypothetical protein
LDIDFEVDALMDRLRDRLPECPHCTGVSVGRHAELFVPEKDRRIWSPWLSVTAEERFEGTVVHGRFAPHPNIWTLYVFLGFGLGFGLLVGTTWGYAQWATERTPWALITIPIVVILGAGLYLASLVGQALGQEQMTHLRAALEDLIHSR